MKIILENIVYKGVFFDHWEAEFPQINDVEEIPGDKLMEYIQESLDNFLKEE